MKLNLVSAVCALVLLAPTVQADEPVSFESAGGISFDSIKKSDADVPQVKFIEPAGLRIDFGRGDRRREGRGRDRWNPPRRGGDRWDPPGRNRPFPGGGHSRTAYSCSATDQGWEEHWGGHHGRGYDLRNAAQEACRSCKDKHGTCDLNCGVPEFRCRAEFVPDAAGSASGSVSGRPEETQYQAEESALDTCRRDFWGRNGRCRIQGCTQESRTVLRERC